MADQEDITQQEALLAAHRRTLSAYQEQLAQLGAALAPPSVRNGITETRKEIKRIKHNLRKQGVFVYDYYVDEESSQSEPSLILHPYYMKDLNAVDDIWNQEKVLSPGVILIVVGHNLFIELLDRLVAEVLREEINKRSLFSIYKRAIIITDVLWFEESVLQSQPAISIGGPPSNRLTGEMVSNGKALESEGLYTAYWNNNLLQIAIWGTLAVETKNRVEKFMHESTGLNKFLQACWG